MLWEHKGGRGELGGGRIRKGFLEEAPLRQAPIGLLTLKEDVGLSGSRVRCP